MIAIDVIFAITNSSQLQVLLRSVILILLLQVIKRVLHRFFGQEMFHVYGMLTTMQLLCALWLAVYFAVKLGAKKKSVRWVAVSLITLAIALVTETITYQLLQNPGRIPGPLTAAFREYYAMQDMKVPQYDPSIAEYDSAFFYRFRPGVQSRFMNREFDDSFHINSKGMRDDEASLKKPQIVCLGDSYALGWGVEQDSTYCQRIESMTGLRALNAGMVSFGTPREMKALGLVDTSAMSVVVWQHFSNDANENAAYDVARRHLPIRSHGTYEDLVQWTKSSRSYYPFKHSSTILRIAVRMSTGSEQSPYRDNLFGDNNVPIGEQAKRFLQIVSQSPIDFSKTRVVIFNTDLDGYRGFIDSCAAILDQGEFDPVFRNACRFVRLQNVLQASDYYVLDTHLNDRGHAKIARELKKVIDKL
jgi:hypothetical protein